MPRNIIDVTDLTVEEIDQLISTARMSSAVDR